jgi:hypothetical protein
MLSLSGVGGNLFPRSYRCAVFVVSRQTAVRRSEDDIPTLPCYKLPSYRNFSTCNALSFRATDCIRAAENVGKMKTETAAAGATETKLSQSQRLKQAVKEYGATVIVFHTCISLFTLGVAYAAVSSGLDVVGLLTKLGVGQSLLESKLATGASTFVIAYAVHKVFVPARMATTLVCAPLIVRYLRRIGFIKHKT